MINRLLKFISQLQSDRKILGYDEAATKQAVILKILSLLGWDTFDVDEVKPEYVVGGKRVDYSLRISGNNKVFIEVKKIDEDLEKHQEQLLNYSFTEGVKLASLTNGIVWWFYLPLHEGSWEQRKFYAIEIYQQEVEVIANNFFKFLTRENVSTGVAITNAEKIYNSQQKKNIIEESLPKAWNKIVAEPNELLVELINEMTEKICGYKPDDEIIENFLLSYKDKFVISPSYLNTLSNGNTTEVTKNRGRKPSKIFSPVRDENFTGRSINSFAFKKAKFEVKSWKELLTKVCETLVNSHKNQFDKVLTLKGRKRPYFTTNSNELRTPEKINNTNIYVEINLSANSIVKLCYELMAIFGYTKNDLIIITNS